MFAQIPHRAAVKSLNQLTRVPTENSIWLKKNVKGAAESESPCL